MIIDVCFDTNYEGIEARGTGVLKCSDLDTTFYNREAFIRRNKNVSFVIRTGITAVEKGFFDEFVTLKELIIPASVRSLELSEETLNIFRNNRVVIRGEFSSYAEKFAMKHNLVFMHMDIELVQFGSYSDYGRTIVILKFSAGGIPRIYEECNSSGISASSMGGCSNSINLPENFYKVMNAKEIGELCWPNCSSDVASNSKLKAFLERAKERNGFIIYPEK